MDSDLSIVINTRLDAEILWATIRAWNERYGGSTEIYMEEGKLREFADRIAGFPATVSDERLIELGTPREQHFAGGYSRLRFRISYRGSMAGAAIDVHIEEDVQRYSESVLDLQIRTEAACVDRFVAALRSMDAGRRGEVRLNRPPFG